MLFGCSSSLLFAVSGALLFPTTYIHLLASCTFKQADIFFLVKTVVDFLLQPGGLINFLWVLCKYWLLAVKGECLLWLHSQEKDTHSVPITCCSSNLELFAVTTHAKPKLLSIGSLHLLWFLIFAWVHVSALVIIAITIWFVCLFVGLLSEKRNGCLSQYLKR